MTDGLVAFLNARLDEDERELAKDPPAGLANLSARMHREVEAKRKILSAYTNAYGQILDDTRIRLGGGYTMRGDWVVRQLAAVYSDHPGYDQAWAAGM